MTLPVIEHPVYEVNLTSRGITKFRPFIVKEQKILMMAVEGKELASTVKAIKQIIASCVVDKIDVDALPMVDLELLFINLRARSMGEIMEVYYECQNMVESEDDKGKKINKPCKMVVETGVNLLNIKAESDAHQSNKIALSADVGVQMHYPSFDLLGLLAHAPNNMEAEFIVVAGCIDLIYDNDNVYKASDVKPEELQSFVMNLPTEKYELMKAFILKAPKVKEVVKQTCPKCQYEHTFTLEGLNDFFI